MQFENAAVVQPQSFPDRVASLHSRIERADGGLIAMEESTVYVNHQIPVLFVELLKHF
jgi:hypothetical protein